MLSGADELQAMLVSVFPNLSKDTKIVALHEKEPGLLYDLRLVCASPEKFASDVYTIVTDANRKRASPLGLPRYLLCPFLICVRIHPSLYVITSALLSCCHGRQ